VLFVINMCWMSFSVAILCTRFRDVPQIITNFLQVVFFLTPIFWSIDTLPHRPAFILWNPLYHLVDIVRAPLLGQTPTLVSWATAAGLAVVGSLCTILLYRRTYARIPYWV
jgi:ABC-type polysaccharide/polyol phosphate export permease